MRKIIYDCDPGIDDALAIILALQSKELQLMGITTVAGNVDVYKGTRNALSLLEYFHKEDIPVARGSGKPLNKRLVTAEFVHGQDGLGNINLPLPKIKPNSMSATDFLIKTVTSNPNEITLVATGPLTNIAKVINSDSDFSKAISDIVIMGGAVTVPGNVTHVAEYNVWADAEAAKIVLESSLNITLLPLDVTMSFIFSIDDLAKIKQFNTPITNLISRMLPYYINMHKSRRKLQGCYIHDALAMAFTIDSKLLKTKRMGIEVTINKKEYGKTKRSNLKPAINVSWEVYSQRFLGLFIDRITKSV